ncbi:hypothetical protein CTEN210_05437 [Chaetoceros tenuissimus]|uniref:Methyltransferase FkbM domain-containing protein n=1 Tax=Chaetoceros tenuissimus TaxID=426638 RepID=A0AAD3H3I8_9STRA|nr:hypothetical protein CTEN210_05437 [Chaetoceros tenuissimus]
MSHVNKNHTNQEPPLHGGRAADIINPSYETNIKADRANFRTIYIYANRKNAVQELPKREDYTAFDNRAQFPFSQVKNDFVFVDLAANHAWKLSNTLYLEQNGWDGLCIEGSSEYWYDLARSRNCTVFGAFVGGNEGEDGNRIEIALGSAFGGIIGENMDNKPGKINKKTSAQVTREIVSFSTILQISNSPKMIDYLSLDVEGAETLILQDFPFDEYTFRFITIERPKPHLEKLLNKHGYREVMKLVYWGETLWIHEKSVLLSTNEIAGLAKNICNEIKIDSS